MLYFHIKPKLNIKQTFQISVILNLLQEHHPRLGLKKFILKTGKSGIWPFF